MPETDLDLLKGAALEAGRIAKSYFGKDPEVWDKPGEGPVTEADLAVNAMLESDLRATRPDFGWLSEETQDNADRLNAEHLFIVDPIDGTRSFIAGQDTWSHSLAVVKNGQVTAAVVYLPMLDRLYAAELGQGAMLNGDPLTPSSRDQLTGSSLLVKRPTLAPEHWTSVPDVKLNHRPSLAYRLALVAQGRFDAMMTLRPTWEWDIAAGDLILREAGAKTSDRYGRHLSYNNPRPQTAGIIGGNEAIHSEILDRLA